MKRIFESEVIYRLITDQLFQAGRDGRSRLCTRVSRSIYFEYISRGSQRSDLGTEDRIAVEGSNKRDPLTYNEYYS